MGIQNIVTGKISVNRQNSKTVQKPYLGVLAPLAKGGLGAPMSKCIHANQRLNIKSLLVLFSISATFFKKKKTEILTAL